MTSNSYTTLPVNPPPYEEVLQQDISRHHYNYCNPNSSSLTDPNNAVNHIQTASGADLGKT